MQFNVRFVRTAAALACVVCALGISVAAQITVTLPVNGSTTMPVQLTANVPACNGSSNITLFGYSIDSSPFMTRSPNNGLSNQISTTEYRLSAQPAPGAQYTIRFKAWSSAGQCPEVDRTITVQGPTTHPAFNVDDVQNAAGWSPNACFSAQKSTSGLTGWYWVWDAGTAECTCPSTISGICTGADSTTYTVPSPSPNLDGQSRLFYVNSHAYSPASGTPGERSSEVFGNNSSVTHFVYDSYVYFVDPQNVQNLELDTNQADSNGNLFIFGLQCAHASQSWEYTTNASGQSHWTASGVACDPQSWTASVWHHVQLAVHRVGNGVYYDSVTLDGVTKNFNINNVNSFFILTNKWTPGTLLHNFQLDAINNSGNETTITGYVDGMTMIWW